MDECKYFRTNNFYLAAFLFSKNLELVSIDKTDPKKCVFVFVDTLLREMSLWQTILGQFSERQGRQSPPNLSLRSRAQIPRNKQN